MGVDHYLFERDNPDWYIDRIVKWYAKDYRAWIVSGDNQTKMRTSKALRMAYDHGNADKLEEMLEKNKRFTVTLTTDGSFWLTFSPKDKE